MDIPALSMAMATNRITTQVSSEMLAKSLDQFSETGEDIAKMMELSVNPSVGSNFDVSV